MPDIWVWTLLATTVFGVSVFNAAMGPTGGVSFAVMASVLPPQALIPVHGTIEAISALYRAVLLRAVIDWAWVRRFVAGTGAGLPVGLLIAGVLPSGPMLAAIGVFILAGTWWPSGSGSAALPGARVPAWLTGALSTGLTMTFGATGPLVAAGLAGSVADPRRLIGTHAAVMTVQHGIKMPVFALGGFDFLPWLSLLGALCMAVYAGTWIGKRLLGCWPSGRFRLAFRLLMSLLGLRLVAAGSGLI